MNYFKTFLFCGLIAFMASCGGGSETTNSETKDTSTIANADDKNDNENTGVNDTTENKENISEDAGDSSRVDQIPEHSEQPEELQLPDEFKLAMPGWDIIPIEKWLSDDFKKAIDPNNKLVYADQVLIRGRFNDDQHEDIACFVMNDKNEVRLVVIPKFRDTYGNPITIPEMNDKIVGQATLGMGLQKIPAGKVKTLQGEVSIDWDGIGYALYGKSGGLYHFKGGKFVNLETGD